MAENIKVLISPISPLVIETETGYSGFEIDLWEAIARESQLAFVYENKDFTQMLEDIKDKKADIGFGGITVTEPREEFLDFSHPVLDSGLAILVNKNHNKISIIESFKHLLNEGRQILASALLTVLGFIFIMGHLMWFAELGANTFSTNYFPGIFESFWLVICSMSTDSFGDYVPHTWLGRILTILIIIGGVAIFGVLIAQVTTFLTLIKIKGVINSKDDLRNKRVATKRNSIPANVLKKLGALVVPVREIDEAYRMLAHNEVDAVVFDAPELIYAAEAEAYKNKFGLIGGIFAKQKYGIVLQQNSSLRESVNRALLRIRESGKYDELYRKWFQDDLGME